MATKLWKKKYELLLLQHENEMEELRLGYEKKVEELKKKMAKDDHDPKWKYEFLQERYRNLVVKHCAMLIPDRVFFKGMPKLTPEEPQAPNDPPPRLFPRDGGPFGYPPSSPRGGQASPASTLVRNEDQSGDHNEPSSSAIVKHGRAKKESKRCRCGQHFQRMAGLDRHLMEKVRMKLECALCCDVVHTRTDAVAHMKEHGMGEKKPVWICIQCNIFFPSREGFKEHQDSKERDKRCSGRSISTAW